MREKTTHAGGVIHTYQKYDPRNVPSPTQPPPDLISGAMEHLLYYGGRRALTPAELARAVRIDPRQIAGLGPSLDALMEMLRQRKQKILSTYETDRVQDEAARGYRELARTIRPPSKFRERFRQAVEEEQLFELERLWYRVGDEQSRWARQLVQLMARLGDKYQIEELAAKYTFTGRTPMTVSEALPIKEELEAIDRLLEQLAQASETAQVGMIDLEELAQFAEPGELEQLRQLGQQVEDYLRQMAEQQGLENTPHGYQLTPHAMRLFQGKLLERIFSHLKASRTGRHQGPIVGEGAVELQQTQPYQFGDSLANMDVVGSLINAMVRDGVQLPVVLRPGDIEVHRTRNSPKCATVVLLDMSGSMRYDGLYVDVKRMGLALDGLIRREYPGDYLQFVELASFAKARHSSEIAALLPKPVTVTSPVVRLRADMSDPKITEFDVPPHFTNIQHGLQLARRFLAAQDTPNRQVILITDGLPTSHFEGQHLYLLYPPDSLTEQATMREGVLAQRDGITINIFLLSTWYQSREDVQFAYRLAQTTAGRVFFTAGKDLDRYVVWDYLNHRRDIVA
ncbi:MAG: vWA domain-containing protein [Pirellulaceae bacterium]